MHTYTYYINTGTVVHLSVNYNTNYSQIHSKIYSTKYHTPQHIFPPRNTTIHALRHPHPHAHTHIHTLEWVCVYIPTQAHTHTYDIQMQGDVKIITFLYTKAYLHYYINTGTSINTHTHLNTHSDTHASHSNYSPTNIDTWKNVIDR